MQLKTALLAAAVAVAGLAIQPSTAQAAGSVTADMNVKIQIQNACQITTAPSDLDFGTAGPLTSNVDQKTTFGITCTDNAPFNVGLNSGLNGGGDVTARKMDDGAGDFVSYQLYSDSTRSTVWGNTINTDTVADTGTGNEVTYTVYGRVAPQTTPPAGAYQDTVAVTVTY
jgi:spore coat protein U-like protein